MITGMSDDMRRRAFSSEELKPVELDNISQERGPGTAGLMDLGNLFALEELREDLRFQLDTSDEIDWDYFVETAKRAQSAANREGKNMKENK